VCILWGEAFFCLLDARNSASLPGSAPVPDCGSVWESVHACHCRCVCVCVCVCACVCLPMYTHMSSLDRECESGSRVRDCAYGIALPFSLSHSYFLTLYLDLPLFLSLLAHGVCVIHKMWLMHTTVDTHSTTPVPTDLCTYLAHSYTHEHKKTLHSEHLSIKPTIWIDVVIGRQLEWGICEFCQRPVEKRREQERA